MFKYVLEILITKRRRLYIHDTHILVELDLGASFGRLYTTLSFTGLLQWIFKALEEVNWRQPLRNLLDQCHVEADGHLCPDLPRDSA